MLPSVEIREMINLMDKFGDVKIDVQGLTALVGLGIGIGSRGMDRGSLH